MKIHQFMTKDVVTISMDDSLAKVKEIFESIRFHHLLVMEKHDLVGVISDRDLLKALSPNVDSISASNRDLATLNKRVHQIMSRKPIVINHNENIKAAIDSFNQHTLSCLPVVDDNNKLVGIISWRDIMRLLGGVAERHQAAN